jgi:hypothetical protein
MATSTIPAAKAALLALIEAQAGLATVQTEWAHPGAAIERETVYFGQTRLQQQARAGNRPAYEDYTLEIVVDVSLDGNDPQAAETRMWELVGEVEQALRPTANPNANASLSDTVLQAYITGMEQTNFAGDQARLAECVISVRVQGRK